MSTVTRPAIGFKFGTYPSKKFSCTREEFVAANGRTKTVPVGIDPIGGKHYVDKRNKLDGRTGAATFAVDDNSDFLPVLLDLPPWLNEIVDEYGLALSCYFDNPRDKRLLQIDLVDEGFVSEAVIFAAGDPEGAAAAVCFAESDDEEDDHDPYQRMHELLANDFPEACDPKWEPKTRAEIALRHQHDEHVYNGAACDDLHAAEDDPQPTPKRGPTAMSDAITFSAEELDEMEDQRAASAIRFAQKAAADQAATVAKLVEKQLTKDAVTFSADYTKGPDARLTPAQGKNLLLLARELGRLDHDAGEAVTFSAGDGTEVKGTYIGLLEKLLADLKPLGLKSEQVVTFALDAEPTEAADAVEKAAREERRKRNQAAFGGKK